MDRHDIEDSTAESVAIAHQKDLKIQSGYNCKALTYWYDEQRGTAFCLFDAPSAESVKELHSAAHGLIPSDVIKVELPEVMAFLGRVSHPEPTGESPIHEPAFRALLFTDVVDSTGITRRLGDDAAAHVFRSHNTIIRKALITYGGREIDNAGDGFLSCFHSAESAVKCAIAVQQDLQVLDKSELGVSIEVRVGIGAGEPVAVGPKLFGSVVNQTARICSHAKPGQILVSKVVRNLCVDRKLMFSNVGFVELKGFPDAIELDEVIWKQKGDELVEIGSPDLP